MIDDAMGSHHAANIVKNHIQNAHDFHADVSFCFWYYYGVIVISNCIRGRNALVGVPMICFQTNIPLTCIIS